VPEPPKGRPRPGVLPQDVDAPAVPDHGDHEPGRFPERPQRLVQRFAVDPPRLESQRSRQRGSDVGQPNRPPHRPAIGDVRRAIEEEGNALEVSPRARVGVLAEVARMAGHELDVAGPPRLVARSDQGQVLRRQPARPGHRSEARRRLECRPPVSLPACRAGQGHQEEHHSDSGSHEWMVPRAFRFQSRGDLAVAGALSDRLTTRSKRAAGSGTGGSGRGWGPCP
jgi:hypothetical protein